MPTPTPILTVTLGSGPGAVVAKVVHHPDAPFDYGIDENGPYRTVTYAVDDSQADGRGGEEFCNLAKGTSDYATVPHAYPGPHRYPNNPTLLCVSIGLEKIIGPGKPTGTLQGSGSVVNLVAKYRQLSWDAAGDNLQEFWDLGYPVPWASVDIDESYEEYQVEDVETVADGVAIKRAKTTKAIVTYTIRRTMIPSIVDYRAIMQELVGKVNGTAFMGCLRGTLKIESFGCSPVQDPSGIWVWEFTTVARFRPVDWNKHLVPGKVDDWDYIRNGDGGSPVYQYPYTNLTPMLSYGIVP